MNVNLVKYVLFDEKDGLSNLLFQVPISSVLGNEHVEPVREALREVVAAVESGVYTTELVLKLMNLSGFALTSGVHAGRPDSIAALGFQILKGYDFIIEAADIWGSYAGHEAQAKAWEEKDFEKGAEVFNSVWMQKRTEMIEIYRKVEAEANTDI